MTRLKFYDILKMATIIQEQKNLRLPSEKMSSKIMHCCWYIAILNPFYSGLFMKRLNYFKLMLKGIFWTEILKWNNTESIYISMLRSGYVLEQNFWGSHGPVRLESCGSELTFAGIWPEDPPYFECCIWHQSHTFPRSNQILLCQVIRRHNNHDWQQVLVR